MSRRGWILNQIVICVFGIGMSFLGYDAFLHRFVWNYHYGIMLDLGEHHDTYGIVVMAIGAAIFLWGVASFRRWHRL